MTRLPRPAYRVPLVRPGAEAQLRASAWRFLAHTLLRWIDRSRQRHDLAALDAHLLQDIGVTPAAAARECAKPFWME